MSLLAVLVAAKKGLNTLKATDVWWTNVATQFGHLQTVNMKPTQAFFTVISGGINNWNLNFAFKPINAAVSDFRFY